MPKPSLIVTSGASVSALWARLGGCYELIVPARELAQAARGAGVPDAAALPDFFGPGESEIAATRAAQVLARSVLAMPAVQARLAATYAGTPRPAPLNGHFADWWPGYLLHHAQQLANRITALDNLARQRTVSGVVMHEDLTPDNRTLALWAKTRGIPSVHIPHAPCHLRQGVPDIHRTTTTDYIAASGPRVAEFYAESGTAARIEITGAPQWDVLYTGILPGRDEARRVLGLDDGLVLAYATTWTQTTSLRSQFDAELRAGLAATLSAARAMGAVLIVKLHPGEPPNAEQHYAQAMQTAGVGGMVTRNHTPYVLRAADVLLAQGPSNICVEAATLGTPSAYIQTEGFDFRSELPFRCSAGPDIVPALDTALNSRGAPEWQAFVRDYNAAHPDGDAIERAAAFVESVCP